MAVSNDDLLLQQLAAAIQHALQQLPADPNYTYLVRFYSNLNTVNSKAFQAGTPAGARPSRAELVTRAALHMYAGQTDGSYFISFSEDIVSLLQAIRQGAEVSWAVKSIIMGGNPAFYGKKGMENISLPPAQHVGIFRVRNADLIRWSDQDLIEAVSVLRKANPQYADLKMNFREEREDVAYYPAQIEAPVATVDNPLYQSFMSKVPKI
jgi:hypothetical protein